MTDLSKFKFFPHKNQMWTAAAAAAVLVVCCVRLCFLWWVRARSCACGKSITRCCLLRMNGPCDLRVQPRQPLRQLQWRKLSTFLCNCSNSLASVWGRLSTELKYAVEQEVYEMFNISSISTKPSSSCCCCDLILWGFWSLIISTRAPLCWGSCKGRWTCVITRAVASS